MCLTVRRGDVKRTRELKKRKRPFAAWKLLARRPDGSAVSLLLRTYEWKAGRNVARGGPPQREQYVCPLTGWRGPVEFNGGVIHAYLDHNRDRSPGPDRILVRVWIHPKDVVSVGDGGRQVCATAVTIRPKTWEAILRGEGVCR